MEKHLDSLAKSVLFKNIEKEKIKELLNSFAYTIKSYEKEETIAIEGDDCYSLGIILSGSIEIHKPYPSGKVVTINHFQAGNIFGEALVFSGEHKYPATIVASDNTDIMFIHQKDIIKLMSISPKSLESFVSVLSNRILMLNNRLTNLSFDTLRKKIAHIILMEHKRQKSNYIVLPYSRKKMAELLNIPRPSLSRELMNMKEDNLIDYYRNRIKIINIEALKNTLL